MLDFVQPLPHVMSDWKPHFISYSFVFLLGFFLIHFCVIIQNYMFCLEPLIYLLSFLAGVYLFLMMYIHMFLLLTWSHLNVY
ncbi:hypothetical protein GDO81_018435 [Engystomops pustulosus]|uniref:Uncharacterized protein n=1 Tax=Engystomops pustulosus TaxID=76066 RepID=A0AAV6ZUA7_ENGPU|nr:hypothetical protein GDO81_018435 [Engystomops pustulosus]